MENKFDLIIVGGSMVGATLACALADSPLKIAIIEAHTPEAFDQQQSHDLRVSALNIASEQVLRNVGVWQSILDKRSCVYRRLKTWELDESRAATEFDCADSQQDHLGYIIENRVIQLALLERIQRAENLHLFKNNVASIDIQAGASLLTLDNEKQLITKLIVGADGANSMVRRAAGIGIHSWDYSQSALVINVEMAQGQQDITWQQFTPSGPLAFLPLSGNSASLVWYGEPDKIARLSALDNETLCQQIMQQFPAALGKVNKVLAKGAFPLKRQHAQQYVKPGVALVGDAAHLIHPLAGQGVNIGILDAAQLAQTIEQAAGDRISSADEYAYNSDDDFSSLAVLQDYERKRRNHNLLVMQLMDSFYRVFSNQIAPLKALRNIGLGVAQRIPFARKKAMQLAMGITGPLPPLARTSNQ